MGLHLESVVKRAFVSDDRFFVAPCWGNVVDVDGTAIPSSGPGPFGSVDGLVFLSSAIPKHGSAVLEIKNKREWLYPESRFLWDIISNGYTVEAVPVFLTRKIYRSTFVYVRASLRCIGIQLQNQLVPAHLEPDLGSCRTKDSLGFKDLLFTDDPPPHMLQAIGVLANQLPACRERMLRIRGAVLPVLDELADKRTLKSVHQQRYDELQDVLTNL
jgi:hypothetical protein